MLDDIKIKNFNAKARSFNAKHYNRDTEIYMYILKLTYGRMLNLILCQLAIELEQSETSILFQCKIKSKQTNFKTRDISKVLHESCSLIAAIYYTHSKFIYKIDLNTTLNIILDKK